MKYETKFKYNDVVKVIATPELIGELISVKPKYLQDGVPVYSYIMHNPTVFFEVRDIDIVKLTEEELEDTIYPLEVNVEYIE